MSLKIGTKVICTEERLELIGTGEVIDIDVDGDIAVKFPSMDSHYSNEMYRLHSCRLVRFNLAVEVLIGNVKAYGLDMALPITQLKALLLYRTPL